MTEIWIDFDPNLDIPVDLKNARPTDPNARDAIEPVDIDSEFDIQDGDPEDDLLDAEDDEAADVVLDPPSTFVILEQYIRIGADGTQVVDVLVEVEDIPGALNYEYRITLA